MLFVVAGGAACGIGVIVVKKVTALSSSHTVT
jgi:hypothetical protein